MNRHPIPVTAAGGVVYRFQNGQPEVLLIKRRGVWDLPKGKIESDETIPEGARREVSEETGIALPEIEAELGVTVHEYELYGAPILKTTHWFAMTSASRTTSPQTEEEIEETRWVPLQDAISKVAFDNLRIVLERFAKKKADFTKDQP